MHRLSHSVMVQPGQRSSSSSGCSAKSIKYSRTFESFARLTLCTVQVKRIKTAINLHESSLRLEDRQLSLETV